MGRADGARRGALEGGPLLAAASAVLRPAPCGVPAAPPAAAVVLAQPRERGGHLSAVHCRALRQPPRSGRLPARRPGQPRRRGSTGRDAALPPRRAGGLLLLLQDALPDRSRPRRVHGRVPAAD
eukprot:3236170-Prymnesium_polylepis.1